MNQKITQNAHMKFGKEVSEHRPYIDANKLTNVRRDIMNKKD